MNKEGLKYAGGVGAALATGLGAGYADLQHVKKNTQKRLDAEKKEEKIEEMKRKQEPSGAGGETKATPIQHKAGGMVSSASKRADGCAVKGKTKGKVL
jgi:hypothetical protein